MGFSFFFHGLGSNLITTVGSERPEDITFQGKWQKKSAMGRSVPKRWAQVDFTEVFRIWQAVACDSGNKIAASAHGMGSGGLAVDAMAIGCLGVERRVERFFSYLAISSWYLVLGSCVSR